MVEDNLDEVVDNITTTIERYDQLTRGNYLASIPLVDRVRGAPIIRHLSLEGQTDHGEALRNVLTYGGIDATVQNAFSRGEFRFSVAKGFHGVGFDALDPHAKHFLKTWESEYLAKYNEYRKSLDSHNEIKNYKHVMIGALKGVAAGAVVGVGLDALSTWSGSDNVYWEIGARSLPAILEAEEIARPFFSRFKEWTDYKRGISNEKPKPFTSTEIWALTQLAGPIVGFGMLVVGEEMGWNQNPLYRATAVFTVNTGNNVIGAGSSFAYFFSDVRKTRFENDPMYAEFRFNGSTFIEKLSDYAYNLRQVAVSRQRRQNLKDDVYLAACNFWADSFQSSNALVAAGWYGTEVALRYFGIAAEQADFGGGFGGKTLAAVESGLLSCDTAAAAKTAIEREKFKLHSQVRLLTSKDNLDRLYLSTNSRRYTAK